MSSGTGSQWTARQNKMFEMSLVVNTTARKTQKGGTKLLRLLGRRTKRMSRDTMSCLLWM
ncbi:unnamed protein product [Rhodiola kirilowii]